MSIIKEIETISGFDRNPSESVSEYLSRLGAGAGIDEEEVTRVREAVHTEMYSPDPLPEERRATVESFAEAVSERASPADVEPDAGVAGGSAASTGSTGSTGPAAASGDDGVGAGPTATERSANDDGSVAGTLESAAARWDRASKSSRRKFLSGAGVVGVLAVGGAAAGIGALGGSGDGNGTAALGNASSATATGSTTADEPTADATGSADDDGSEGEVATEPAERTSLSEADLRFEEFDLAELERSSWPQEVPAECQYGAEELSSMPDLVYRDGDTGFDPFASARTVLGLLRCYELTEEPAYLDKAMSMGTALHEAGEAYDGGLFFPHEFPVEPHVDADWTVREPWYSATTQGLALSAFARLYVDGGGESAGRYGVDVLRSLDSIVTRADGPVAENPWGACLDDEGYLWLEKYAQLPASHVFSGHNVAAWGLYEMWLAYGSELARDLFRASATTTKARADAFRNEGGVSDFCLAHGVQRPEYHRLHVDQLGTYHELTGDDAFAAAAERFAEDYDPSA
ncbi:D-glucuronyl C5-epimerase family protein [Halobium salinum]|uniref:D-glucuronyl C5-epimerase family protein n=1 Tax=Halobium salinum TaxID=1364940 RepID=A0ABD5P9D1_9EURY|nr:D-glucuronyl C5-epimerase family protein [Halobium salinum]